MALFKGSCVCVFTLFPPYALRPKLAPPLHLHLPWPEAKYNSSCKGPGACELFPDPRVSGVSGIRL